MNVQFFRIIHKKIRLTCALLLCIKELFCQTFTNVAASVGINPAVKPGYGTNGVAVADYDADGDLDIYIVVRESYKVNDKRTWNRLFENKGNNIFQDLGLSSIAGNDPNIEQSYMGHKLGASWGDYDNDDFPDLFLTHAGPNQLFHNNGDGTFTDITAADSMFGGATQVSTSALWFDYDLDGDLDLHVGVWDDYNLNGPGDIKNQMFENMGNGHFTDVSAFSGLNDSGKTWMALTLDANNDGWPDLYLANDFGANKLYVNNGDKTFSNRAEEYGVIDYLEGMGLTSADVDNNGFFDIYLTNVTQNGSEALINPLFLNTGTNSFLNKSIQAGISHADWGWGTAFMDYDNDSDEDLYVLNGYLEDGDENRFFKNISNDSLAFVNVADSFNIADPEAGRGIAVFDYNNDGFQDVLVSNFNTKPFLYENKLTDGNWLKVSLWGTASNRSGFGTVIKFKTADNWYYKNYHGAQFLGQNIVPAHFGAKDAQIIDSIQVIWPSGHKDFLESVAVNQHIIVEENKGIVSSVSQNSGSYLIDSFKLLGNYPNPFNGGTRIKFELSQPQKVEIKIYNSLGQIVAILDKAFSSAGPKFIDWVPANGSIRSLSSGLYFYSVKNLLQSMKFGKMIYLK